MGLIMGYFRQPPQAILLGMLKKGLVRAGNTEPGESLYARLLRVVFLDSVLGLSCLEVPYKLL